MMKKVNALPPLPNGYERIPLDGHNPDNVYVLHRKGSNMYKLYADRWNIALYQHSFLFAVFPAYKCAHQSALKAFMEKYILDSPLEVSDFYPGCSKAFTQLFTSPEEVK